MTEQITYNGKQYKRTYFTPKHGNWIIFEEVPTKTTADLMREVIHQNLRKAVMGMGPGTTNAVIESVLKSLTNGLRDRLANKYGDGQTYQNLNSFTQSIVDKEALAALPITVEELNEWDKV